jgi:signal transduction histidine kinase
MLIQPLSLPDGRSGRAAIIEGMARDDSRVKSIDRSRIRVIVARETAGLEQELGRLRRLVVAIALGVTGLSAAVLLAVVWSGMRPLNRLADRIAGLRADNLSDRITLTNAPTELVPVADVTNQLLERLETAMERERSFTADVAHELRTPLAGARSVLEVALSRDRASHEYQSAMKECLRITVQMQTMTANLLSLARLDRGQMSVESVPAGLESLLRECWEPLERRAQDKSVRVRWDTASDVVIDTDREILRQVLANILDNAVLYVNPGGEIRVSTGLDGGTALIAVSNTGSKIGEGEAERVFDRFWRGDVSRQAVGIHAGLGLPLARRLATLLRGTMTATSQAGGAFTLTLRLPARNGACAVAAQST